MTCCARRIFRLYVPNLVSDLRIVGINTLSDVSIMYHELRFPYF